MSPSAWRPHFAWPPRRVDGSWRWLERLQRRYRFERVGPNGFVGIEEFRLIPVDGAAQLVAQTQERPVHRQGGPGGH